MVRSANGYAATYTSALLQDTWGKHHQMQLWLASEERLRGEHLRNGCFLLDDGTGQPMMRHLDGKSYQDPDQQAALGRRPYPVDWTKRLIAAARAGAEAGPAAVAAHAEGGAAGGKASEEESISTGMLRES